jgi:alkyl hydroperoxide reductase subunit AhpF
MSNADKSTGPELSQRTRAANRERMRRETFDIVVIGGGATGAGVALDAAARGLTVVQVHALGPFALTYVNPSDAPSQAHVR